MSILTDLIDEYKDTVSLEDLRSVFYNYLSSLELLMKKPDIDNQKFVETSDYIIQAEYVGGLKMAVEEFVKFMEESGLPLRMEDLVFKLREKLNDCKVAEHEPRQPKEGRVIPFNPEHRK